MTDAAKGIFNPLKTATNKPEHTEHVENKLPNLIIETEEDYGLAYIYDYRNYRHYPAGRISVPWLRRQTCMRDHRHMDLRP